ncbi:MAG: CHAT domain-containing protein [Anaerolineales bacterium]|nr:CHAT domain-containing protein [Anaerolineales bacterium]
MLSQTFSQTLAHYRALAEDLYHNRLPVEDLPAYTAQPPPLDRQLLDHLADQAQNASLTRPRYGWALMVVADTAVQQTTDPFLKALAAWYLARAANGWFRPDLVETAVTRARTLFTELNKPGWVAACAWQLNAVPWTRPNFNTAAEQLEGALEPLKNSDLQHLLPACRCSLAFTYLLIGRFAEAAVQVDAAESAFKEAGDELGAARCLYIRASYQRRQSKLQPAILNTEKALAVFQKMDAAVDMAIAHYGLAQVLRLSTSDYASVEQRFFQTAMRFAEYDLPLWEAQCYGGLAQVYNYSGQLKAARQALQKARVIYEQYSIPGLLADNLLDSGQHEFYCGNFSSSLNYLQQAQSLYEDIGNQWLPVVALMDQGLVHFQQGQYHQALHHLEKACVRLQELDIIYRLAGSQWGLANVWLQLGDLDKASTYLEFAIVHFSQEEQKDIPPGVFNLRAEILLHQQRPQEAFVYLAEALTLAQAQQAEAQIALTHRLWAEALLATNRVEAAKSHLQAAADGFAQTGMDFEQAVCQLVWGRYYVRLYDQQAAARAWHITLELAADAAPEIAWQAYAALADMAAENNNHALALQQYRQAVKALSRLRRSLWQSALLGAYLARPMAMFDRAMACAVHTAAAAEALLFIEESKSQITTHHQTAAWNSSTLPEALVELVAEIRWLQANMQNEVQKRSFTMPTAELQQRFVHKVKAYDTAVSQFERALSPLPTAAFDYEFDLAQFRQFATQQLGTRWLALDYYQLADHIYCIIISTDNSAIWQQKLSNRVRFLLELGGRSGRGRFLTTRDLIALGETLLPPQIQKWLEPKTHLIIAPHRQLHRLPWAALSIGDPAVPLVTTCIPVITPSLQSLAHLWGRTRSAAAATQHNGIIVAVSDFNGRYASLPAAKRETQQLRGLLGHGGICLLDTQATSANLYALKQNDVLAAAAFLHVATHAFSDQVTGRLSRLALYDQDMWLDELPQLAPLPPLVTLSACGGMRSLIHAGDEQIGLAAACLMAGADSVVGSLQPVLDAAAPEFMVQFYSHILADKGPAAALALTQRSALQAGSDLADWANFQCIGKPI